MATTLTSLALASIFVPLVLSFVIAIAPQRPAKWICICGAAFASICVLAIWILFAQGGVRRPSRSRSQAWVRRRS